MKKVLLAVGFSALILGACTNNNEDKAPALQGKAKGGKYYGGVMRINEPEYFKNLFPHSINDGVSRRIAAQVYEGLFTFDQATLDLKNQLCESYEVSEDGLVYTFKLRKGVLFHDDACFKGGKGRELKAEDVKFSFTKLCTQSRNNKGFSIFDGVVRGARKYFDASANSEPSFDVEGIEILDEYTIKISLENASSIFLYELARPSAFIFPKEAYEKYGLDMRVKTVGTGPFMLADVEDGVSINLKRNPNYYRKDEVGNQLPFLEAINIKFIKEKKAELFEFKKGNLDMIYRLPTEHIIEILEEATTSNGEFSDYEIQRDPEMQTHLLGFQMNDQIFKNKNVRKAFSFAIDREKILEYVLNGEGYAAGSYGITPPTFKNYNVEKIKGYTFNLDSANYYLNLAGYPEGKGFPKKTLDVNPGAERNVNVAIEVQKQLKDHLNIEVDINKVPLATHIENMEKGNSSFFRFAWGADIPVAQNFLSILYGKSVPENKDAESYPNIMRYKNAEFDMMYEKGLISKNIEEANDFFIQAEQIAMNDAPFIVIWYDEGFRLLQSYVKGFPNNPMQHRDFSSVYFEPINKAGNSDKKAE